MYIGAHVSIQGGVQEAPLRAIDLRATALGLFTKNQRQWNTRPLTQDEVDAFKANLEKSGIEPRHVVVHASYLINPASPDAEKRKKSVDALLDECLRAEELGIHLVNFHPGSGLGELSEKETLRAIGKAVKGILARTETAVPVLESTAGQGAHVGYEFRHLADIIDIAGAGKRIGVCIDTCHAYAAGYNLATPEGYAEMMQEVRDTVGMDRLVAIHLNDSKVQLGSRRDRHQRIGDGEIGVRGLSHIVKDPALAEVPFILETPEPDSWAEEIRFLRRLRAGEVTGARARVPRPNRARR